MSVPAPWWKGGVVYQIYPRSYADSNNDGVGDLRGIINRLDHLSGSPTSLGIDAVWISPFYPSPMRDFGYDVTDFTGVDEIFGTLADFDELVAACHEREIRVVIDLVLNHTSIDHPWFLDARTSRDSPRHDWYLWSDGARRVPNNWRCQFELTSAWWPNEQTDERYLGTFTRDQPEVNWRNAELREAMFDVMRTWFDRGVDGFRLDVVNWYLKDERLRSNPRSIKAVPDLFQHHIYDRNRPETHEICAQMRVLADEYSRASPRALVGEVYTQDPKLAASYYGEHNDELHLVFNFALLFEKWNAARLRRAAQTWYQVLPDGAWPTITLSNHDQPRHASRYAPRRLPFSNAGRAGVPRRAERIAEARAKVAAAFLLTLRGTPFLYYGEELGMRNVRIRRRDLQDPLGKRTWPLPYGRDGARTPMQWGPGARAGFSEAEPWLPVGADHRRRNVESQLDDPESMLAWYRRLIALRRERRSLALGEIRFLDARCAKCIAYERIDAGKPREETLVLLNFSRRGKTVHVAPEHGRRRSQVLASTHREIDTHCNPAELRLAGHEALILTIGRG